MADKIKAIKIKQKNGTYSEEVPISVNVQNVQWDENNHTLLDALGSVDISSSGKGNLQHQIDELDGDKISTNEFNSRLNDFLKDQISADTTDWLDDNVSPVGSAVIVDKTLTIEGAAADALAVKTELNKKANASNTYTKAEVNAAIDAKKIEVDDTLSITGTAADAKAVGDELTAVKADLGNKVGIIGSVKGYYIKLITDPVDLVNPTSSDWYSYSIIECTEGDKFVINAVGTTNARAWGFLDSSNHVLSMADANATVEGLELTAPENAVKLIINDKSGGTSYKIGNNLVSRVATLETAEPELSADVKTALMALVSHIGVWTDDNGQGYIDALEDALYEAGTIKVFIGKGSSGSQIIDNPKRALTEPIPFKNEIPITVARSISGEDDGYRYAVKWCVDDDTIWVAPTGYPLNAFTPTEPNVDSWYYTAQTLTWCTKETPDGIWVPNTFLGDGNSTIRILFASLDSIDDPLPALPPKGYIIVQGKRYRLEVGDNEDFI